MSRFTHLGRVGRRSLGAVLLLACLVVAASGVLAANPEVQRTKTGPDSEIIQIQTDSGTAELTLRAPATGRITDQQILDAFDLIKDFRRNNSARLSGEVEVESEVVVEPESGASYLMNGDEPECATHNAYMDNKTFKSSTRWCYDGEYITGGIKRSTGGTTYRAAWTQNGEVWESTWWTHSRSIKRTDGGVGKTKHKDKAKAILRNCVVIQIGSGSIENCADTHELTIYKTQNGNGNASAHGEGRAL